MIILLAVVTVPLGDFFSLLFGEANAAAMKPLSTTRTKNPWSAIPLPLVRTGLFWTFFLYFIIHFVYILLHLQKYCSWHSVFLF